MLKYLQINNQPLKGRVGE